MAQPQLMQIKLSRFDAQPWGFRLQGGVDFAAPLLVQKVNGGSLAEQAGLMAGDAVIKINDVDVFNLRHKDAQDIVVRSGNNFVITVQRGGSTWRPHVTPTGQMPQPNSPYLQTVTKTSLAHKQQESQHIGCGYNNAAKPFGNGVDGNVKSIVNKQYNSPVGIYSDESIAETLSAQAEVLAGGVLGVNFKKNEKEYQADKSEVLKFLREEESGPSTPEPHSQSNYYWTRSHAIGGHYKLESEDERIGTPLQQNTLAPAATHRPSLPTPKSEATNEPPKPAISPVQEIPDPRLIVMPVCPALQTPEYKQEMEAAAAAAALGPDGQPRPLSASGHPPCAMCGVGIVGVFVRIKDRNLHVECFKCATCGTSLKNQGYYNFNNKLYCDIHAKLAALQNPPSGTEGYVPVPIKPNTKLSASTISSALNIHGYGNGVSNGSSTPAPVAPPLQTAITPSSSNLSIVDKSPFNSNSTSQIINDNNNTTTTTSEMSTSVAAGPSGDKPFEYVTLTGNVIRSVVPPGRGNVNYKVNQGGYARPYGAAPPAAAPKSPVSYPPQPQQQWNQPPPIQPKPAGGNAYATLPRSNVGQQEANEESLQPQYAECYFEEDYEVEQANRQQRSNFCWPPAEDDSHHAPTAAPLYIAPPETQHVVAKPLENPPPPPPGYTAMCGQCQCSNESEEQQQQQKQQAQWQSRSAPQLTAGMTQHQMECESGSDSYTSTSTTTTTTSDGYQRMYAAQIQAYQMQQAYEQSGSEFDYHMDMEVAAMQQQDNLQLSSSQYSESGRRSAQECIETLVPPLSTYRLVDMVREVTPSPVPEPSQSSRHVVFLEDPEVKEVVSHEEHHTREEQGNEAEENIEKHTTETLESTYEEEVEEKGFVREDRSHILESQRIFQPTPEIKIEIAPVRHIPPTKIPNPCPKEWINPMVRVLTTAPETPFHMVGCLCPKPCECLCQVDPEEAEAKKVPQKPPEESNPGPCEKPPSPEPEPEPVQINTIWDTPTLSKAMTIAPAFEIKFAPPASEGIPLPEETEPYMPPPIEIKPYVREDYRPKTPLLRALTTAPEKPFEGHFDRDVPIHIIDLPTPKEQLSMKDALRTAPERPYTPLDPENATHMFEEQQKEEERKKQEFQVLDKEEELGLSKEALEQVEYYTTEKRKSSTSAFAAMQAFQSSSQPLSSTTTPRHSISYTKAENDLEYKKFYDAHERYQKRRSYFSQKEQELLEQQQMNTSSQVQEQHYQQQQEQQQTNTREESSLYSATKATSSSSNSSSAVQHQQQQQQTTSSAYASNITQASKSSSQSMAYATAGSASSSTKIDVHEVIEEVSDELEHSEVIFPPPSPLSHLKQRPSSGLHRPESIPKYQRNWTVLPTQSPVRTPEPTELRENVPLAFVDTPKKPNATNGANGTTVHKPVAQISAHSVSQQQTQSLQQRTTASAYSSSTIGTRTEQRQQQLSSATTACDSTKQQLKMTKSSIPTIVEDRSGPVSMAFQALDEHMVRDQSQTPSRPYTPSMINRPAPITPYYQTPEKLCFDECPATHARDYDRRSASPFPDRAKSPAPGPPPNPLAAIRAPRLKETEFSPLNQRVLQAGSITTGQSYLGAQQQAQQQERILSHTATGSQSAMQSYTEEPEKREKMQIGNMTMERSEKASRLEEQKQSQMQSQTTTQVGNTQIQRRRKVTEEFEHTSSAKTVEIHTGSQQTSTERRQSYGKTGFVANQAKRLSGLEQEISNLTSQSQAISARAATMSETKFPELHSPSGSSMFPTKPILPPHDEPQPPSYYISGATTKKLPEPMAMALSPAERKQSTTACGATSLVSTQQSLSQQQQQQQQKSLITSSTTSCSHQQQLQANTVSSSLTKASATTCTNNQAYQSITAGSNLNATSTTFSSAMGSAPSGVCPVTGTFCRPGHTCCKQQVIEQANNNGSRPTASLGAAGFKPQQATNNTANMQPQSVAAAAPAPRASITSNVSAVSNNNNNNDSATGGMAPKGGAFGATSAPKRGRGILNKAVSPGVRVPLCNSCGTQIRGPFITALGKIWCPDHFHCVNGNCRRPLQDIGFVEEKGDLYCEYCFEKYLAPSCSKCAGKIKGDCLNAIGKHFHPECFACGHCGKLFGNTPFFLEDGMPYCEADWNELFTTKCFACGFPVEAGDRWVEALNHNYHSQCFNCTYCKQNLEGQSFYNKGGRPFCKNHAR